jgi:peptidoglycan-N-acetylglucosamine deacetylase
MRFIGLLLLASSAFAQSRQVAITIDDLPRGGDNGGRDLASIRKMTEKLLAPLRGVPLIGFVNAGRAQQLSDAGLQSILKIWLDYGATLGNHSYSHPDLNNVTLERYTSDVLQGEPAITKALGHRPVYFRHPFLHAGNDAAKKRGLSEFLAAHGYTVAPVTFDNSDWMFAAIYGSALGHDAALAAKVKQAYVPYMESVIAFFEERSKEVVGREFPQTLLIHASQLNADAMPDLLAMFRRRGYAFVSLEEALKDDAYRLPENYVGKGGFSWIHRWSQAKGLPGRGEPDEPGWITEEYQRITAARRGVQ